MAEPNGLAMAEGKPQYQFNGINSNNSSRGASPVPRTGFIPASQLPPTRANIPASQLPPTRSAISDISQKIGHLSVSNQSTPNISPSKFSTSTPYEGGHEKLVFSENASPVVPKSMESVPLTDNSNLDVVNRNVTVTQSTVSPFNMNTVPNVNPKPLNQFPVSSASQYFSKDNSFDSKLNGPQIQDISKQHSVGNRVPQYSQHGPSQGLQNMGSATQHSLQQQNSSKIPLNSPFSQSSVPQTNQSIQHQNIARLTNPQNPALHHSQPNLLQSQNIKQFPPVQSNMPPNPRLSQSQVARPASQPQFSTSSGENTNFQKSQESVVQGNPGSVQHPSSYTPSPTQLGQAQNKPHLPPVPHFPVPNLSSTSNVFPPQSHVPPASTISQPQGRPFLSGQSQRPRYPQIPPQNPPQSQNLSQGYQFNSGLPPRSSPYPQGGMSQHITPQEQAQPTPPLPSQRFDPQINYNATPPVNTSPLPHTSAGQASYGYSTSQNGPSTLPPHIQPSSKPGISANRYPSASQQVGPQGYPSQQSNVVQSGFNRLWGAENHDLLQLPTILPPTKIQSPPINLGQETLDKANCSTEVFRCTVTKIPETASLLQKSRLPLGLLIHPFKDLSYLPVIQCNVIVRCRACRTYINPFVYFVDSKRWKCNLCFRINELPEEFQYDPVSKTYGDPSRRPEIKSSTIEYIAPAEYMLRPPQPAVYLYLLDVSRLAVESCYLEIFCATLLEELKNIPGDARTQIGFVAYDSALHFFSLAEGLNQPHELTILDIEDVFLPTPDNLLVNLKDRMELVEDLLNLLPKRFANTFDGNSALGAALQVAHKMMGATGGRVTVFQSALPNIGPGAVPSREDPSQRSTAETPLLNPVNDFYKRLALECSGQQVAVDLFIVNSQYVDIATISGISRFSGGSVHHFPLFKSSRPLLVDGFQKALRRYLTRKIGFEAVMRVRCTRGLAIHTFHGNFFVRSTDLLSLPNINPEAAFGMQVAVEENLSDSQSVCFQAALLYTSSKGERRIRVHTLCLPTASTLQDVIHSADQQCIIGLLGKMAVDRSTQSSLSDAREAFINAAIDVLSAYKFSLNMGNSTTGLLVPDCLKLLPLYISAILKFPAFRIGTATRLDDRVKAMIDMKTKPLYLLMQYIYPDMYPIHDLEHQEIVLNGEEEPVHLPPRLQLTARCLENKGAFLMDCGDQMLILVGPNVPREFLNEALGVSDYASIPDEMIEIPILDNLSNQRLHQFINYLNDEKPYPVPLYVVRDNSPTRIVFLERLIEDRLENSLSYHEFLQHLKTQVK